MRRSTASFRAAAPPAAARRPARPAAAAAAAAPPGGTRLQREAATVVAIDVEYTHLRTTPAGLRLQLPAEVCLVDAAGATLLRTFCDPLAGDPSAPPAWRHTGGVPPADWAGAPPLPGVRAALAAAVAGRPLVGHNLGKDLAALGMTHPAALRRDTMRYPALQGPAGLGRSLAELARTKLGRRIQAAARHDPREDAVAALDLYLRYCHYDVGGMAYDDLVEHYASGLLQQAGAAGGGEGGAGAAA
jgi:hypothetical protein